MPITNKQLLQEVNNIVKPLKQEIKELKEAKTNQTELDLNANITYKKENQNQEQAFYKELTQLMRKYKVYKVNAKLEVKL